MTRDIAVILCGVGGYGALYLDAFRAEAARHGARLVATVDPAGAPAGGSPVPHFASLVEALGSVRADFVVLCTPIHLHARDAELALRAGCHVLCEKPLAGGIADADRMIEVARQSGRILAIGYQWSFSAPVLRLKKAILAGRFGRPQFFRGRVDWPRGRRYYGRNSWAGRLRLEDGSVVNDNPVNNAAAHFLHHMLFLLGPTIELSARVTQVEALLARANPIESFDSAALRVGTQGGVPVLFFATHAVAAPRGPHFILEFELGNLGYDSSDRRFRYEGRDGATEEWGDPDEGGPMTKLWHCIACARAGTSPALGAEGAREQTVVAEALLAGAARIVTADGVAVGRTTTVEGDGIRFIFGLAECFDQAFSARRLPGEAGAPPGPWDLKRDLISARI